MKDIVTDSLRYWEPRRIAFNAVLGLVVAGSVFYVTIRPWPRWAGNR